MANTHSTDLERGSSQSWSITDASQTGLDLTSDMTVEAWVKLESAPSNQTYCIVRKYDETGENRSYMYRYQDVSGTKKFEVRFSTDGTGANTSVGTLNYTLNTATWYHLAFAYDASAGTCEVYVNGSSVGTISSMKTSVYNSTATFKIGGDASDGDYFDGLIDDVRVWSDIRTSTEIDDNKDNCNLSVSEAGLVSWWQFNNDGTDATASGNDLTNNNSCTFSTDLPYSCVVSTTPQSNLALLGVG